MLAGINKNVNPINAFNIEPSRFLPAIIAKIFITTITALALTNSVQTSFTNFKTLFITHSQNSFIFFSSSILATQQINNHVK